MQKIHTILLAIGILYTFTSCVSDLQDIDIKVDLGEQEFAVPLINSTLSIRDALDNFDTGGVLLEDENNFMTLVYKGKVFETTGIESVSIPDFGFPVIDTTVVVPFGGAGTEFDFDYINIKNGNLKVSAQSDITEDLIVSLQIQNLVIDQEPTEVTFQMDYNNNSPTINEVSTILSQHFLDLSNKEIAVSYTAVNAAGQRFRLDQLTVEFQDLEPSAIQGYFGKQSFAQQSDSIVIDIFKDIAVGKILMKEPKIRFIVENNIGIPTELKSEIFLATNSQGETMNFNSVLDQGVQVDYPAIAKVDEVKTTIIQFDNTNSNLEQLINSNPEKIVYSMAAAINPNEDNSIRGIMTDASKVNVDLELELPVWLSAENFTIEETSDVDVSIFDDVVEAEFKLIAENGLPIETAIQLYFEDDSGVVLDSLLNLENNFIQAAQVNASGEVTQINREEQFVKMDQFRINNISKATKIRTKSVFSTSDASNVASKFYTDYQISFLLGVRAIIKTEEE